MTASEPASGELQPLVDIDRLIHEPARLMVMALLYVVESADLSSCSARPGSRGATCRRI